MRKYILYKDERLYAPLNSLKWAYNNLCNNLFLRQALKIIFKAMTIQKVS